MSKIILVCFVVAVFLADQFMQTECMLSGFRAKRKTSKSSVIAQVIGGVAKTITIPLESSTRPDLSVPPAYSSSPVPSAPPAPPVVLVTPATTTYPPAVTFPVPRFSSSYQPAASPVTSQQQQKTSDVTIQPGDIRTVGIIVYRTNLNGTIEYLFPSVDNYTVLFMADPLQVMDHQDYVMAAKRIAFSMTGYPKDVLQVRPEKGLKALRFTYEGESKYVQFYLAERKSPFEHSTDHPPFFYKYYTNGSITAYCWDEYETVVKVCDEKFREVMHWAKTTLFNPFLRVPGL